MSNIKSLLHKITWFEYFGGCGGGQMYQNCYIVLLYNAQNTNEWFTSVGEISLLMQISTGLA